MNPPVQVRGALESERRRLFELRAQAFASSASLNQRNRCPGSTERPAEDKGNPYKPSPDFNCDETQIPPGN